MGARQQRSYTNSGIRAHFLGIKPKFSSQLPSPHPGSRKLSTTVFRLRSHHTLFSNNIMGMQPCPHCGAQDSVDHLLLQCSNPSRAIFTGAIRLTADVTTTP